MSKTVTLVGFSCSGKSTVGEAVAKACRRDAVTIDKRDSDDEIGSKNGGSIAGIYVEMGRQKAMELIESAERQFLESLPPDNLPRLVVTGPNLPLREPQWSSFLKRVDPVVYWLQVEPNTVYNRLKQRHDSYRRKFNGEPNNGSWNEEILCDLISGAWVDIERDEALKRIPILMKTQLQCYAAVVTGDRIYSAVDLSDSGNLSELVKRIVTDMQSL